MVCAIRYTKLSASASVPNSCASRARGLNRPNQPLSRLVLTGMVGSRELRTKSCQRSSRCCSSFRTGPYAALHHRLPEGRQNRPRRTRPCPGQGVSGPAAPCDPGEQDLRVHAPEMPGYSALPDAPCPAAVPGPFSSGPDRGRGCRRLAYGPHHASPGGGISPSRRIP